MLEIETLFKSYFDHWSLSENSRLSYGGYELKDDDREIAIIREFIQGNVADGRLSALEANSDASMVQMFVDAAESIHSKLTLMEQLAEKAANGHYTSTDKNSMQKIFELLGNDVNSIVNSTEYDDNKLFTSEGETITKVIMRDVGSVSTINLFAKDLSVDMTNMDLTTEAEGAQAMIRDAIKQASEVVTHLNSQNQLLHDAMAVIEDMVSSTSGINTGTFGYKITKKIMSYLTAAIQDDPYISSQMQSNITAKEALYLLKGD
jgi:flagellin-like hook-associated protein FlgL